MQQQSRGAVLASARAVVQRLPAGAISMKPQGQGQKPALQPWAVVEASVWVGAPVQPRVEPWAGASVSIEALTQLQVDV